MKYFLWDLYFPANERSYPVISRVPCTLLNDIYTIKTKGFKNTVINVKDFDNENKQYYPNENATWYSIFLTKEDAVTYLTKCDMHKVLIDKR